MYIIFKDLWENSSALITPPFPLRELPPDVVDDLSTDQVYAYRLAKMITTGIIDWDLLQLTIGKVNHCRWLTTGSRYGRLYISKHGLVGNDRKNLRAIVEFDVIFYFPMFFEIKADSTYFGSPPQTQGDPNSSDHERQGRTVKESQRYCHEVC